MVLTTPFQATADLTAKMAGMPGYGYAVIAHPISRLGPDALRELARESADRVAARLVREPR